MEHFKEFESKIESVSWKFSSKTFMTGITVNKCIHHWEECLRRKKRNNEMKYIPLAATDGNQNSEAMSDDCFSRPFKSKLKQKNLQIFISQRCISYSFVSNAEFFLRCLIRRINPHTLFRYMLCLLYKFIIIEEKTKTNPNSSI